MAEVKIPKKTYCDCPMIECPHCGQTWQWPDSCGVETGSMIECAKCERTIYYVAFVHTAINNLTLSTHPEE